MSLFVKVFIYTLLVLGLCKGEQHFQLLTRTGLSKGPWVAILLILVYLIMLYLEARSCKRRSETYSQVRKKTFILSFSVGIIWGVVMSFAAGFHYQIGLVDLLIMLTAWFALGCLFGLSGRALATKLWVRDRTGKGQP